MVENLLTREYFDALSYRWKAKASSDSNKISRLLSRLDWQRCQRLMDVGCGTGVLFPHLKHLMRADAIIFAVDFAEKMIQEAARTKYSGIELLCGCTRYLPFRDSTLDRIIAFQVMPHVQGKEKALQEYWRILRPYGDLVIMHIHGSSEINAIHETVGGLVQNHTLPPAQQMILMLKQANFLISDAVDCRGEYFVRGIKNLPTEEN